MEQLNSVMEQLQVITRTEF